MELAAMLCSLILADNLLPTDSSDEAFFDPHTRSSMNSII
jgi:hypothetical protein